MTGRSLTTGILLWLALGSSWALAEERSPVDVVQPGQWLQVRGQFTDEGAFEPSSMELVEPRRYEELIGTATASDRGPGWIELLGQPVEITRDTDVGAVDAGELTGDRLKVEGYFRSERRFSARELRPRGEGRDRIIGRVDRIRAVPGGTELSIMRFAIVVPSELRVKHDLAVTEYAISDSRVQAIVDRDRDEENLFGRGAQLTDTLRVAGQMQLTADWEDNYNLRDNRPEDIQNTLTALKGRLIWNPEGRFFAVVEYNLRRLWRDDERDGNVNIRNHRFAETYGYWLDAFTPGLDVQVGRVKYEERREFLYDQDLDGPRLIYTRGRLRSELSVTTTMSDGSREDENALNTMWYLSNDDDDRHMAGYLIHRDFDLDVPLRRTHVGFRMHGVWLPRQKMWLELAHMRSRTGGVDGRGWALDIGTTWRINRRWAITGGYAIATGDDRDTGTDETFRQTGLQDNNDRFAGVTSFRYYGELTDPELANLEIATLGLGWLPRRRVSLDLVAHRYRQNVASRRLVDMQIDRRPNGVDRELGTEVDLILGWRTDWKWDLELVAGWFDPGEAFGAADDAVFGKVQFRYRL